jgi:hypothetical protein
MRRKLSQEQECNQIYHLLDTDGVFLGDEAVH